MLLRQKYVNGNYLTFNLIYTERDVIILKWLYKLEYKYGRFAIQNLMIVIIFGQAMVFLANLFVPEAYIAQRLALHIPSLLQGEVWRIFTFIFVPQNISNIFFFAISALFYFFIGRLLEGSWSAFKFNVYYFLGVISTIFAGLISYFLFPNSVHFVSTDQLHLTLFFAVALLYPDIQIMLFYVIPVKMKYMAFFSAAVMVYQFILSGWSVRITIVLSLINFFLFFGGNFLKKVKQSIKYHNSRRQWRKNMDKYNK